MSGWTRTSPSRGTCPGTCPGERPRGHERVVGAPEGRRAVPGVRRWFAATALVHGLTGATRNVRGVARTGVAVLDPFGEQAVRPLPPRERPRRQSLSSPRGGTAAGMRSGWARSGQSAGGSAGRRPSGSAASPAAARRPASGRAAAALASFVTLGPPNGYAVGLRLGLTPAAAAAALLTFVSGALPGRGRRESGRCESPHPALRATFSRREKVGNTRHRMIAR